MGGSEVLTSVVKWS